MNKITPHLLRDLDATLPPGTECYLCASVRRALSKYRKGRQAAIFVNKDQAVSLLAQRLGRGLKRFLTEDVRALLPGQVAFKPEKMA
ncbi:hypothetical protein [Methylomonas rapida]|uniref:Uncharacterized protein n=1 Tax=Methylomonas rapida TaxID=2963939 RepID=A0ABY7GIU4_9GAMM|nr:hypothetical protein [Methylomonas rapida]WAR44170.1 hypothetical protein NM686_017605 [Methylomonas rapida]